MSKEPRPPFPEQPIDPPGEEGRMRPRPHYQAPDYRPAAKLAGKVALITGGDSGIGRAVALMYAREGADLVIVHTVADAEQRDAAETRRAVQQTGQQIELLPGDVRDPEFCRQSVERTLERFQRLDVLVNNAAYQRHQPNLDAVTLEQWDQTFRTNIYGYFYMARAAVPHMQAGSAIINTGSITGLEGSPGLLDYSATKGAIHAFTKSLAANLVNRGIRVNCVAPGPVWTPLNPAERGPEAIEEFGADTPFGRPAQPEEIAPAYVFLASSADSGYITGHVLSILGGETTAG